MLKKIIRSKHRGMALIISMIFVLTFSTLALSLASMSGANLQLASTQHEINSALNATLSGQEIIRYHISRINIPGTTPILSRFSTFASAFQTDLTAEGISNVATAYDGSQITISNVTLNSDTSQSFSAEIMQIDNNTMRVEITGLCDQISRTIRINYLFGSRAHNVFNYGVATKGPLSLSGNIELEGINVAVEASVYIESENSNLALSIIGNSQIAGDVSIVNPLANVYLQGGQAGIGGETGNDAIENHVTIGAPPTEFPTPDPTYFEQYITNTIDANTDASADRTYENVRIAAGTNPNFTGNVTLSGIIYIETPNVVTFAGNTEITGIIVGNGDILDNSQTNQINITGSVVSNPVGALPDEPQFADIKNETGTFLLAPGFGVSFGGAFNTLSGTIAANGVTFFGNAGGTIDGSILNYSDEEMELSGNSDLYFNRSGIDEIPAGFVPEIIFMYTASTYEEIIL